MVRRGSEGHGSLAPAKKTVANTCSCLQRPFSLLITCQSIRRQPDQMSAAARRREGGRRRGRMEGGRGRKGTDCMSGKAENEGEAKRAAACAYQRCVDDSEQTARSVIIPGRFRVCGTLLILERRKTRSGLVKVGSCQFDTPSPLPPRLDGTGQEAPVRSVGLVCGGEER